jgi:hypothetical protein
MQNTQLCSSNWDNTMTKNVDMILGSGGRWGIYNDKNNSTTCPTV